MISRIDKLVTELSARKEVLIGDIEAKKGRVEVKTGAEDLMTDDHKKEILDEISKKQLVLTVTYFLAYILVNVSILHLYIIIIIIIIIIIKYQESSR